MTLTLQQAFDKAAVHLLKQGVRSIAPISGQCMYRGDDGRMCAVGALISDEAYSPALEGKGVYSEHVQEALRDSGGRVDQHANALYLRLQQIHDEHAPEDWRDRLRAVSRIFDLNTDAIDAL